MNFFSNAKLVGPLRKGKFVEIEEETLVQSGAFEANDYTARFTLIIRNWSREEGLWS